MTKVVRNAQEADTYDAPGSLHMQVLGPLRLWREGVEVDAGSRMQRCALALLLARADSPVSMSEMISLLWGEAAPPSAVNTVHKYVGTLRRLLEPDLGTRSPGRWLLRNGSGYRLAVPSDALDLSAFRRIVAAARKSLAEGDEGTALRRSVEALRLWHGPAGDGLAETPAAQSVFAALDREHLRLAAETGQLARKLSRPHLVLDVLWQAVAVGPLHEPVHAELVANLAMAGHHSEALSAYHAVRARLADELGILPSPPLQSAYQSIGTRREPAVNRSQSGTARGPGATHGRPAQLPPRLPFFVGRADLLSGIVGLISPSRPAPTVVAFDGMPGIGKTALALHLAHTLVPTYPDGQLHLDLRGFAGDGRPLAPETALRALISGLGVEQRLIPEGRQAMAGLYRTLLSDRRMIIVLDDARSVEQLLDLIPSSPGSITLITSRSRMTALRTAVGAHLVPVGLPAPHEARALLATHFGDRIGNAAPQAVYALVERCGLLPLALAHAGASAATYAALQPRDTIEVLRLTRASVDETFGRSYRELSPSAAHLFRCLAPALEPGGDITAETASVLTTTSVTAAQTALNELNDVGLLQTSRPGSYRWHTLVRAYATSITAAQSAHVLARAGASPAARLSAEAGTPKASNRRLAQDSTGSVSTGPPVDHGDEFVVHRSVRSA
ncbi:BTAD domain-containing putative transcriptional regulator [Streptomyces sp. NPDC013157]|uniref:AfsR/SARP family transcriptional regulator n=1 Tax=Streptomyces sp. NPDC013157 TaxID=3364861 RepID=UPI00367B8BA0